MPSILPLWTYTYFFLTPLHPNSQHLLSPFQGKPLGYWNSHAPRVYRKTQFILLGHYMHVWGTWYCFAIWLSNSMQVASSLTFFFFFALSMIYFYDSLLTGCVPECQQFFFAESEYLHKCWGISGKMITDHQAGAAPGQSAFLSLPGSQSHCLTAALVGVALNITNIFGSRPAQTSSPESHGSDRPG